MTAIVQQVGDGAGVRFDGIWKKFRRGEIHDSLRDLIPAMARRVGRGVRRDPAELDGAREFWALRDVSFDVAPGEALGIIGANGAGKSTVLKTLNRILQPTRGYAEYWGRAGALIEISAGFHPDLTGRQNVFLQGAIMGMRRREIERKFDEIVEFSGIADFIDTPVKRYSSGMNARLGFSIAAHLDPDVLIIDEVLAVGDMSFQDRAFGRIRQMVTSGIPVVIVSHQLDRVASLCTKGMLLEKGAVAHTGSMSEVIAAYHQRATASSDAASAGGADSPVALHSLEILSPEPHESGGPLRFRVRGWIGEEGLERYDPFCLRFRSVADGKQLFRTAGLVWGLERPEPGEFVFEGELQLNVAPGIYRLETTVNDRLEGRDTIAGPKEYVQVTGGARFEGVVQMNAALSASRG